ncbi:LysM peptidoglycan-binding domain-containing protein [Thiovibrio sp. JS02]
MKKVVATAVAIACALSVGNSRVVLAEDATTHQVKRGDTLWDLSDGYLKDPLLWPKIWKINPDIENPHRIAPGQIVKIPMLGGAPDVETPPVSSDTMVARPEERTGIDLSAIEPLPVKIVQKDLPAVDEEVAAPDELGKYYDRGIGIVSNDIPKDGKVLDTKQGWQHSGYGESIVIAALGARVGQQFGVYRDMGKVDALTYTGKSPGHLLADIAIIEIVSVDSLQQQAVVKRSFAELREGDVLGPVPERPTIVARYAQNGPVSAKGSVVAVHLMRQIAGADDIVYMDIGKNQGLSPGDRLFVRDAEDSTERRNSAELIVLRVTPTTAAGVVTGKSSHDVRRGDKVGPIL